MEHERENRQSNDYRTNRNTTNRVRLVVLVVLLSVLHEFAVGLVHHLEQQLIVDLVDGYATSACRPVAQLAEGGRAALGGVLPALGQRPGDVELGAAVGPAPRQRARVPPPLVVVAAAAAAAARVRAAALAERLGIPALHQVRALQPVPETISLETRCS